MGPTPSISAGIRRYRVHEVLGQGGFGTVYRADLLGDDGFTKEVALKLLHRGGPDRADHLARLRDEARMLGLARHRALVTVDALIRLDGRPCVVMERVHGVSLDDALSHAGPLPAAAALEIVAEVAAALSAAYHTEVDGRPLRLLHRDIKPSNVLVTAAGDVKLLDFGVARAEFDRREAKTQEVLYGSPAYMAPERLELEDFPGGDVFALGITLTEITSGVRAQTVTARPGLHRDRVDRLLDAILPELRPLVAQTLAYEPTDRPDAATVERECRALVDRVPGPRLREWAAGWVAGAVASQQRQSGELSGRVVAEDSDAVPLRPLTTWDEFALPEPPPVRAPPAPRRWLRWVAGLVGIAGTTVLVGVGLAGVLALAAAVAIWPGVRNAACVSMVDEMDALLRSASAGPPAVALTPPVARACRRGELGLVSANLLLMQVQQSTADGTFDGGDTRDLDEAIERTLGL